MSADAGRGLPDDWGDADPSWRDDETEGPFGFAFAGDHDPDGAVHECGCPVGPRCALRPQPFWRRIFGGAR